MLLGDSRLEGREGEVKGSFVPGNQRSDLSKGVVDQGQAGRRDLLTNLMRKWRRGWRSLPGMGLWAEGAPQQKWKSVEEDELRACSVWFFG